MGCNKDTKKTSWPAGQYRFLYSCPEAIAVGERLNELLLQINLTLYSLSVNFQYRVIIYTLVGYNIGPGCHIYGRYWHNSDLRPESFNSLLCQYLPYVHEGAMLYRIVGKFRGTPYHKHIASQNALLCRLKSCLSRGRAVSLSQDDTPFSLVMLNNLWSWGDNWAWTDSERCLTSWQFLAWIVFLTFDWDTKASYGVQDSWEVVRSTMGPQAPNPNSIMLPHLPYKPTKLHLLVNY